MKIYKEFGKFSGLQLNIPKTVVVPLWRCRMEDVKAALPNTTLSPWMLAHFSTHAVYLGFQIGPGRVPVLWDNALHKYMSRVSIWGGQPLGLHLSARTYNIFPFRFYHIFGSWRTLLHRY